MCQRWDEVFVSIAQEGATEMAMVRLSGFLLDYPKDSIAQYHAERFRTAARNPGEAA